MPSKSEQTEVACFGGAHTDLIAQAEAPIVMASSNPGTVNARLGGVALNVARALSNLNRTTGLVGCVGQDSEGDLIFSTLANDGIDVSQLQRSSAYATGRYVAIEGPDGELSVAVSDTRALDHFAPAHLGSALKAYADARFWFADANLAPALLTMIAKQPERPPLAIDAVSVAKVWHLIDLIDQIDVLFCNLAEAQSITAATFPSALEAAKGLAESGVKSAVVTNGAATVGVYDGARCTQIVVPPMRVTSVTGAGDTLIAGTIDALLAGKQLPDAAKTGIEVARRKLIQ